MGSLILEVQDPNTPPERLRALAKDGLLAAHAAQNPNTPIDVLISLGAEHPREMLQNPVLPLLLLETPSFFRDLPMETLRALIQIPESPLEVLAAAENFPWFEVEISAHPKLSMERIKRSANSKREDLRRAAARNPSAPEEVLLQLAQDPRTEVRWNVASNSNATEKVFRVLLRDCGLMGTRYRIAANPIASEPILRLLSNDSAFEVRMKVAQHSNTATTALRRLSSDEDERVRAAANR